MKVKIRFAVPSSMTLPGETAKATVESLSIKVPIFVPGVLIVYPVPGASMRPMVSFGSATESAVGSIAIAAVVEPAPKVIVPVVAA